MNESVLSKLYESINSANPDELEGAVNGAWQNGMMKEYAGALNNMLLLEWHFRHEDIVNALQEIKSPSSIEALYLTALKTYEYLDYDEDFALARKCTWALADIGTTEAKLKLSVLQKCDNQLISNFALKRLQGWDSEQHRKGS